MEQFEVLEIEQEFENLYCLPEKEQPDPVEFKLVVETANYRIEIEIG